MKLHLIAVYSAGLCLALGAGENILENGGFEKVGKIVKSDDPYTQEKIKNGWDFGSGPVIKGAAGWVPNEGAAKVRLTNAAEDKESVHSGEHALRVSTEKFCSFYAQGGGNGKYEISFFAKGKAPVMIAAYCYGVDAATGNGKFLKTVGLLEGVPVEGEWTEFKKTVDFGEISPDMKTCALAFSVRGGEVLIDDISMVPVKE